MYRRNACRLHGTRERKLIDAFFVDELIGPVIDALPARCPQREMTLRSASDAGTDAP